MQDTKPFEDFIIKCCELDEWDLRDFLRASLTDAGFTIQEDDYKSHRGGRYREIHNMLAIRGDKPRVCLVAHTDVCRDHGYMGSHQKTIPVIKEFSTTRGNKVRVIQDKYCRVQVGGDDRLGVAINTWIALNTGYDMGLLYTTEEEIGGLSADECEFTDLMKFELCAQVDRGNRECQLVTQIGGIRLCSREMATKLLDIADQIGLPRQPVHGLLTDVLMLKRNNKVKNAVNMTCGYHNNEMNNEFIQMNEAIETKVYVNEIIKSFELESIGLYKGNIYPCLYGK